MGEETSFLTIETLISIALLMLYVLIAHALENKKVDFLHESGVAILMGALAGLASFTVAKNTIQFSNHGFFYFILPPIIFAAGYTLKRRNFMKNLTYILLLGFIGTIISMVLLSIWILVFNEIVFDKEDELKLLPMECLLFAAVLWATDSVSVLSVIKEKTFPTLNSILFGEGIVNDAVSILIYEAVASMISTAVSNNRNDRSIPITFGLIVKTWWNFIYISILSIICGSCFGFLSAFVSKNFTSFKSNPQKEVALIVLIAYMSYISSEMLGLSAIMSLFACGVTMSHYTYHNISDTSKSGSIMAINTLGHVAEAFLFIYLGIGIYTTDQQTYNMKFTILVIIGGLFLRFASVLIPIGGYAYYSNWKISIGWKEIVIIWFSGTIRGAIAFALSLKISPSISVHK